MRFTYDLRLVYRTWQKWVMSGRKDIPDIRQVAMEDDHAVNDVWMMDFVIRYLSDTQSGGRNSSMDGEEG